MNIDENAPLEYLSYPRYKVVDAKDLVSKNWIKSTLVGVGVLFRDYSRESWHGLCLTVGHIIHYACRVPMGRGIQQLLERPLLTETLKQG